MSTDQYFRAGTGTIIYNKAGQILLFARADRNNVWQLQQGGMDAGETVDQTLWRELKEETSINEMDVKRHSTFPTWLYYKYPDSIRVKLREPNVIGQIHTWHFLELNEGVELDISLAEHKEFSDCRWGSFDELLKGSDILKSSVYEELAEYFNINILPSL